MTGAEARAYDLASDLESAGWTVTTASRDEDGAYYVTVTACKTGREIVQVTYRSVTAPGKPRSTSLASVTLDHPVRGITKLEGPRALRAWLAGAGAEIEWTPERREAFRRTARPTGHGKSS
jgi:hypothetical protein